MDALNPVLAASASATYGPRNTKIFTQEAKQYWKRSPSKTVWQAGGHERQIQAHRTPETLISCSSFDTHVLQFACPRCVAQEFLSHLKKFL